MPVEKKLKLDPTGGGLDIPAEPQIALFLGLTHIGLQRQVYEGVESLVDKVFLQFELQDVLTDKGTPIVHGKLERNSFRDKANLIKFAKAIGLSSTQLEEGVDFEELVGKPVMINFEKNKNGKVSAKEYSKLPAALKGAVKPLMNTPRINMDVEELTESQLGELPEFIRKMVKERVGGGSNSEGSANPVDL